MLKCKNARIHEFRLQAVHTTPVLYVIEDFMQEFTLIAIPQWDWSFQMTHTVPRDLNIKQLQQSLSVAGFINYDESGFAANTIADIVFNEIPVKAEYIE